MQLIVKPLIQFAVIYSSKVISFPQIHFFSQGFGQENVQEIMVQAYLF